MQKGFRQSLEALYRRSQRESNAHASYGYAQLLMSLIQERCALFKRPELPFIFAQLPNYTLEPDCEPMGPLPVMAIHKDDGIEISFIHTGGGLVCTGDVPFDILEPGGSIYRVKACRYDCHGGHGTGRASGAVRELSPVQCQFVGQ